MDEATRRRAKSLEREAVTLVYGQRFRRTAILYSGWIAALILLTLLCTQGLYSTVNIGQWHALIVNRYTGTVRGVRFNAYTERPIIYQAKHQPAKSKVDP